MSQWLLERGETTLLHPSPCAQYPESVCSSIITQFSRLRLDNWEQSKILACLVGWEKREFESVRSCWVNHTCSKERRSSRLGEGDLLLTRWQFMPESTATRPCLNIVPKGWRIWMVFEDQLLVTGRRRRRYNSSGRMVFDVLRSHSEFVERDERWRQWANGFRAMAGRFYTILQFNLGERRIPGRSLDRKVWCYMRTSKLYSDSTGGCVEARKTLKELQK